MVRVLKPTKTSIVLFFGFVSLSLLASLGMVFLERESVGHFFLFTFNFLGAENLLYQSIVSDSALRFGIIFVGAKWGTFYLLSLTTKLLNKPKAV
jgi:hypothetical protein